MPIVNTGINLTRGVAIEDAGDRLADAFKAGRCFSSVAYGDVDDVAKGKGDPATADAEQGGSCGHPRTYSEIRNVTANRGVDSLPSIGKNFSAIDKQQAYVCDGVIPILFTQKEEKNNWTCSLFDIQMRNMFRLDLFECLWRI
jgi:hypothetical protein